MLNAGEARRPNRMWLVVAAVLVAQLADTITFAIGVANHGIGLEGNPLMRAAYELAGLGGVVGAKTTAVGLVLTLIVVAGGRFPRLVTVGGGAAAGFGLLGAGTNSVVMAMLALG